MVTATAQVAPAATFTYQPPAAAISARRVLIKPNLGYPVGPPVTVGLAVLGEVIAGVRRANPTAEIVIVEGVCSKTAFAPIMAKLGVYGLLGPGITLLDADELELMEYANRAPQPVRFTTMMAPRLLQEVDCCLSVSAFKRTQLKGEPLISASLKNLYGLFPRARYRARSASSRGQLHRPSVPLVLQDVHHTIGHFFQGGVVDLTQKFISRDWQPDRGEGVPVGQVVAGESLLAVDRAACAVAGEDVPSYVVALGG